MRYVVCIALLALVLATPLKAQEDSQMELILQSVIDLSEMEQVLNDFRITEKLYLVQTPVLQPDMRLMKFGQQLEVTNEESAYFRSRAYVKFTDVSETEPSGVVVSALVSRPGMHGPGEGVQLSFVLKAQEAGWILDSFQRSG